MSSNDVDHFKQWLFRIRPELAPGYLTKKQKRKQREHEQKNGYDD
jgi:hypothetical protein